MAELPNYASVCFLDDLKVEFSDVKTFETKEELAEITLMWWNELEKQNRYWRRYSPECDVDLLLQRGYLKWCRVEKYYAVCVSINFESPLVWSKDCEAETLDWTACELPGEVIAFAKEKHKTSVDETPEDYDVNPVIKFMDQLYGSI